jgi:hypothetical protein
MAARGDTVLDEEDGNLRKEGMDAGGGLESREQSEEGGREVFVRGLELTAHMAETEAGGRIQDGETAAAADGGVMAATVLLLGVCHGESLRLALA